MCTVMKIELHDQEAYSSTLYYKNTFHCNELLLCSNGNFLDFIKIHVYST